MIAKKRANWSLWAFSICFLSFFTSSDDLSALFREWRAPWNMVKGEWLCLCHRSCVVLTIPQLRSLCRVFSVPLTLSQWLTSSKIYLKIYLNHKPNIISKSMAKQFYDYKPTGRNRYIYKNDSRTKIFIFTDLRLFSILKAVYNHVWSKGSNGSLPLSVFLCFWCMLPFAHACSNFPNVSVFVCVLFRIYILYIISFNFTFL